jgi:hypothetical protein
MGKVLRFIANKIDRISYDSGPADSIEIPHPWRERFANWLRSFDK